MALHPGTRLGPYEIVAPLGAGGMGEVLRARDTRLGRDVAIKVLPQDIAATPEDRGRFAREARSISALNHPNICVLYDIGREGDTDYLVMELVEGETVADRLAAGPLPEREIVRLGEQLAEGLAAAHRAGVLHRDVKPSNLRVTPDGRLKILDFGLARLGRVGSGERTETMSETGAVKGTVPYMPPEQLSGEHLDERTDLWAAGAVLYEMATGRRPFEQGAQARLIAAILHDPPVPPRNRNRTISQELERIVLKCLEKDPAARFQTAEGLASELRGLGHPPSRVTGTASRTRARRSPSAAVLGYAGLIVAAAAALLAALNVGGLRDRLPSASGSVAGASLAVLPLSNISEESGQEYFADGMTDELITRLAQVRALRVISRTSVMQYKGTRKRLKEIARELGVGMIVEGTVARADSVVRISARLVNVGTERPLWAESYERTLSNVLILQSDVARAIVENVRVRVTPGESERLGAARPVDARAHEEYLRGLAEYNEYAGSSHRSALRHFRNAIEIDPSYAAAHAAMAATYAYLSGMWLDPAEAIPRARASALKAIEIDPNLASAHAVLAYVKAAGDWDWKGAEAGFRRALDINSNEVLTHQNYGALLVVLGRFEEAREEFARARRIDPLSPLTATMSLWPLFEGRRYHDAIREARTLVLLDSTANSPRMVLGQALTMIGDHDAAIAELRKAIELDPSNPFPLGWLALAYGAAGRRADALGVLDRLQSDERDGKYIQPYTYAMVYIGLRDKTKALEWLEIGFQRRSDEMAFLKVDPGLDLLRGEPRFQALLAKMTFPS